MRNLRNVRRSAIKFADWQISPLTATCWDLSDNSLVCAFGPTPSDGFVELKRLQENTRSERELKSIASWDLPSPQVEGEKIISLHYFVETASICIIFAGGDIVRIREQPLPGEELLEIVGSIDAGIEAAQWSPDEELVAIVTKAGNLLLMSRDFEAVEETPFSEEDENLSKHVNVGWGKKETQFHGKRAKALRDPTMPESVASGTLSAHDRREVCISWRGDGQFVTVNAIEQNRRRMIRVYSREGILDSVSEPVDYLEGALSWRPAGNIIAGIQRKADVSQVVFFEKNGLRHGEFSLRRQAASVATSEAISLRWNVDSTVLAVAYNDCVQLWTMGNYHYYLKQEIRLPALAFSNVPLQVQWHPEKPLSLVIHHSSQVKMLEYCFAVAKGSTCPPNDYGLVAVVDGSKLPVCLS